MIKEVLKLKVKYNDALVGYLAKLEDDRIAFQYAEEWIEHGFSISPFSLPLSNEIYINKKNNFDGLYGVFQDSLPDGWGALLQIRNLAKIGININKLSPLTKLALCDKNGLGALSFELTQYTSNPIEKVDLDDCAIECEKIFNDETNVIDFDKIYALGGSSGGARPKIHLKTDDGYWIVKFPCRLDENDIGVKEFEANSIAKQCGINVNDFKLFSSKRCNGYFGAKRFDRECEKRIHMVSLSSLLETSHKIPNLDYIHLFQVIENICVDNSDIYEAYRRMCFNVFYQNKDDHGKNFAFLFDEKLNGYKLSPAFDLTRTLNKAEHEMTVNGNGKPTEKDLLEIAKIFKLSFDKCEAIIERCKQKIYFKTK